MCKAGSEEKGVIKGLRELFEMVEMFCILDYGDDYRDVSTGQNYTNIGAFRLCKLWFHKVGFKN